MVERLVVHALPRAPAAIHQHHGGVAHQQTFHPCRRHGRALDVGQHDAVAMRRLHAKRQRQPLTAGVMARGGQECRVEVGVFRLHTAQHVGGLVNGGVVDHDDFVSHPALHRQEQRQLLLQGFCLVVHSQHHRHPVFFFVCHLSDTFFFCCYLQTPPLPLPLKGGELLRLRCP